MTFVDRFGPQECVQISKLLDEVVPDTETLTPDDYEKVMNALVEKSYFQGVEAMPHMKQLYEYFDTDSDGNLNKKDFLGGIALVMRGTAEEKLRITFDLFDTNGDGVLDRAELYRCVKSVYLQGISLLSKEFEDQLELTQFKKRSMARARDQVDSIFVDADTDGSYTIDFAEFRKWGMGSPIVRLLDREGKDVDVHLTFLTNAVQEEAPREVPPQVFVDLISANLEKDFFRSKLFGIFAAVKILDLNWRPFSFDGNVTIYRTKLIHDSNPYWNESVAIDGDKLDPSVVGGILIEIHQSDQKGLENLIGGITLDWAYLNRRHDTVVEYTLLPEIGTVFHKEVHGSVKINVRTVPLSDTVLPHLKSESSGDLAVKKEITKEEEKEEEA